MTHHIPIFFDSTPQRHALFQDCVLFRYAVHSPSETVLETLSGRSFIEQGTAVWQLALRENSILVRASNPMPAEICRPERNARNAQVPAHVQVSACWYPADAAENAGISVYAGKNANTFGKMGVILVPDRLSIPVVDANRDNVRFYGLQLIQNDEKFVISSLNCPVILMEYLYKENYRDAFLEHALGGGGLYVETHHFPHIHVPLSPTSGGYILIGKRHDANTFSFTAFVIPYGYALYTPSGTIHGDGTLVGRYAISVTPSKMQADTVLFYDENTFKKANNILFGSINF